jgi:hypothetical protein
MSLIVEAFLMLIGTTIVCVVADRKREAARPDSAEEAAEAEFWRSVREDG